MPCMYILEAKKNSTCCLICKFNDGCESAAKSDYVYWVNIVSSNKPNLQLKTLQTSTNIKQFHLLCECAIVALILVLQHFTTRRSLGLLFMYYSIQMMHKHLIFLAIEPTHNTHHIRKMYRKFMSRMVLHLNVPMQIGNVNWSSCWK